MVSEKQVYFIIFGIAVPWLAATLRVEAAHGLRHFFPSASAAIKGALVRALPWHHSALDPHTDRTDKPTEHRHGRRARADGRRQFPAALPAGARRGGGGTCLATEQSNCGAKVIQVKDDMGASVPSARTLTYECESLRPW